MSKRELKGNKYGRWTVILFAEVRKGYPYWFCKCTCGKFKGVAESSLLNGISKSCGCIRNEATALRNRANATHGMSGTRIYTLWHQMHQRCREPNRPHYRNISVCARWTVFSNFYTDMGLPPTRQHSLDRIDSTKDYQPDNVRWATRKEQQRNTTYNVNITYQGKTQCIAAWAEELGLKYWTLHSRIKRGWSIERALTTP